MSRIHTYMVKRNLRIAGSVTLLLIGALLISLLVVRTFTIQNIVVDAPGMTIELDNNRFGKNLLFLPIDTFRHELLATYPLLSDARFEKKFPGTLVVHLVRRAAFAHLRLKETIYAVDVNGLVLGIDTDVNGYPLLEFDVGTVSIGNTISDGRVRASLSFLAHLSPALPVSEIKERDSTSLLARMGNTNIFLPQTGDLGGKADTLQIITEGFRIKGALPAVIDLRFAKPIVTN